MTKEEVEARLQKVLEESRQEMERQKMLSQDEELAKSEALQAANKDLEDILQKIERGPTFFPTEGAFGISIRYPVPEKFAHKAGMEYRAAYESVIKQILPKAFHYRCNSCGHGFGSFSIVWYANPK